MKNETKSLIFLLFLVFCKPKANSQNVISLEEVVKLAQAQSPQYKLEQTRKELCFYQYLIYKSDLHPQISFQGSFPGYNKQYAGVIQPEGTISYVRVKQNTGNIGFSLSQKISLTGGIISLNTNLSRFDDFQEKTHQYNATPAFIYLNQPLFGFNEIKWAKKIEPLKLNESKKSFVQAMEGLAQQAAILYFDVLDAQEMINISKGNLTNSMENYELEQKRILLGTTTEDRLLQLELQSLTNRQGVEKARYNYQVALLRLKALLGSNDSTDLRLVTPEAIPVFTVSIQKALEFAHKNRPEFVAFERRRLEAERDMANARASKQQVNLTATFGLNRAGTDLGAIYSSPKDQQAFAVGINVPVIDWGRRNAAYNSAKANWKLIEYYNEIDEIKYNQEIATLVKNISLIKENIALIRKRDSVAYKRYIIANNLYRMGKLTVSDLNIAQNEKDNAHHELMSGYRSFWDAFYLLRRVTLYDFENERSLFQ